jgi:hypothetical protein
MVNKSPLLYVGLFLIFLALVNSDAFASWRVDKYGGITVELEGAVLGKTIAAKPEGVGQPKTNGVMLVTETAEAEAATSDPAGPGNSTQAPGKAKVEVKISTGSNGMQQIDIKTKEKSPTSVRAVPVKDSLKLQVFDENQEELELMVSAETDEIELEDSQLSQTTRIRSKDNASYVIRNKIAAQSHFPIMVNLETNELIITTPKGQKTVTILPDKAVENMLAANVLDQLGGKGGIKWLEYQDSLADNDATGSGDLEEAEPATESGDLEEPSDSTESSQLSGSTVVDEAEFVIELTTTDDGTLAYEIDGEKTEKFLGLTEIKLKRKAVVSAETGELLGITQDFRTRLLDIFSF